MFILKDNNLVSAQAHSDDPLFGFEASAEEVLKKITDDVRLLSSLNCMDYSLLVALVPPQGVKIQKGAMVCQFLYYILQLVCLLLYPHLGREATLRTPSVANHLS